MLHLVIVPAKQSVFVKAHSHCTRLRPEVPINKGCRLHNVKSWNHFHFYDVSMVFIVYYVGVSKAPPILY